jgi:hypothetical protein
MPEVHLCVIPYITRNYVSYFVNNLPYQYTPYIWSFFANSYFGIEKTSRLIQRLKGEPNLRLLCGFTEVPGKTTFSRTLAFLAE